MNERLKELAKQAGATLEKGYIELSDGQLMLSDNVDLHSTQMCGQKRLTNNYPFVIILV
jgi:hypothetical protein